MWECIQFVNSDLVDHPRQRPDFKQPLNSFVFVPTVLTLMAPKSRKTKTRSGATPSCAKTPDLESECIAAQSESLLDGADGFGSVITREMLRCWQSLPSTTRKAMLPEVKIYLTTRFRFGLREGSLLADEFPADYGNKNKGKRNCQPVLEQWLSSCSLWLQDVEVLNVPVKLSPRQKDTWLLLGDIILRLPRELQMLAEKYCSEVHDLFLTSWQYISSMMKAVECVCTAFKSLPFLSCISNPIADSRYAHRLSEFFDYVVGWEVLPCCIDSSFSVKSVKTVYGDRSRLDTFYMSLYRSTKFGVTILYDVLENTISALAEGVSLESKWLLNSIDELFLFLANPATSDNVTSVARSFSKHKGEVPTGKLLDLLPKCVSGAALHQPPGIDPSCNRSFLKRPRRLFIEPSFAPACSCSEEKPSKRCLHYCWWFWDTVLGNLLPVLSDLEKTQGVISDVLDLAMGVFTSWKDERLYVIKVVNSVTQFSKFTCNRFLLSSVRAIEKLASFCKSTRMRLDVDKTVDELMCKSVLGLSSVSFPVLSVKPEDFLKRMKVVKYLVYSPVEKYFEEEFTSIKKLQKLAQYEQAVVSGYLKRKDWI